MECPQCVQGPATRPPRPQRNPLQNLPRALTAATTLRLHPLPMEMKSHLFHLEQLCIYSILVGLHT